MDVRQLMQLEQYDGLGMLSEGSEFAGVAQQFGMGLSKQLERLAGWKPKLEPLRVVKLRRKLVVESKKGKINFQIKERLARSLYSFSLYKNTQNNLTNGFDKDLIEVIKDFAILAYYSKNLI